jgi:hypothetical protein
LNGAESFADQPVDRLIDQAGAMPAFVGFGSPGGQPGFGGQQWQARAGKIESALP